jgi:hypothetical protein
MLFGLNGFIILRDSKNLSDLTPIAAFLGGPLTQKKGNRKIADSAVDPSHSTSSIRFGMKRIKTENSCQKLKEHHNN